MAGRRRVEWAAAAWLGALLALGIAWFLAIDSVRVLWWLDPQYTYGLAVPLLAAYLYRLRWNDRPAPGAPWPGDTAARLACVGLGLAYVPALLLREATPDWRLLWWFFALGAVVFTLVLHARAGGRARALHLAFPICFFLVAVPWPTVIEAVVMHPLMRANAALVVEILHWLGFNAVPSGRLVQLESGILEVETACSGIRSLQLFLMTALFLGEMRRLPAARRVELALAGVACALVLNTARTLTLGIAAARRGVESIDTLHDRMGFATVVVGLGALWMLACRWNRAHAHTGAAAVPGPPLRMAIAAASFRGAWAFLACVLGGMCLTEAWYRWHERNLRPLPAWSIQVPPGGGSWERREIPERVVLRMRFDDGIRASGNVGQTRWEIYWLRWNPGANRAASVGTHQPLNCLRGVGYELDTSLAPWRYERGVIRLPFVFHRFRGPGGRLHALFALVDDRVAPGTDPEPAPRGGRLEMIGAALRGRRQVGQSFVEIGVWNAASDEEALRVAGDILDAGLIQRSALPPPPGAPDATAATGN